MSVGRSEFGLASLRIIDMDRQDSCGLLRAIGVQTLEFVEIFVGVGGRLRPEVQEY